MKQALPDLLAYFRVKRGLFRKELVEASVYELDGYGCVMKTDKLFSPGDTVVLDLVVDMPFDKLCAENLQGLITERRKHCSNFFYSIDFVELNSEGHSSLSGKLKRIREVVAKKQSLKSRRSTGPGSNLRHMA